MKKIYTKSVFEFDKKTRKYVVNEKESEFHYVPDDAPIAQMKGGGDKPTQVNKTDPWGPQANYLKRGFGQAQSAFLDNPPPDMTFSPETLEAQQGILNLSRGDNNLYSADRDMLEKTIRGDYLTGGEGFNKAIDAAKSSIIPSVDSNFASRGRSGSGLAAEAKTSAIGDAFAKQYETERGHQLEAGRMAPAIDQMKYAGVDRIAGVGRQKEALTEANTTARQQRIMDYMKTIGGNYGGTQSQYDPKTGLEGWKRYLAGAAGGGLTGFMYGGPWGAAAGAGLGLLGAYSQ